MQEGLFFVFIFVILLQTLEILFIESLQVKLEIKLHFTGSVVLGRYENKGNLEGIIKVFSVKF